MTLPLQWHSGCQWQCQCSGPVAVALALRLARSAGQALQRKHWQHMCSNLKFKLAMLVVRSTLRLALALTLAVQALRSLATRINRTSASVYLALCAVCTHYSGCSYDSAAKS